MPDVSSLAGDTEQSDVFRAGRDFNRDTKSGFRSTPSNPFDQYEFKPINLELLGGHPVTYVSAGERHVAALNVNGELWVWGANGHG